VSTLLQSVNVNKFRDHLVRWLVRKQLSFAQVEDEDFRQMLLSLSQAINPYLVQSATTIRNWVQLEYNRACRQVKEALTQAKSRIHISFDLWTSPNGYTLYAVCAHFVGPNYRNCSVLLGIKRIKGSHSGENIAEIIIPVLQQYEITQNLGVFVADNAESNDTAIKAILTTVRPDLNHTTHRSRCLGHIINLAAKAFIFGKDVEAFEAMVSHIDENDDLNSDQMKKAQLAWRTKGVIGRFHNLVIFIRSSPQRREAFKRSVIGDDKIDGKQVEHTAAVMWCQALILTNRIVSKCLKSWLTIHRSHGHS
jgi:hypothetical protein